jgi:hypothetical protein
LSSLDPVSKPLLELEPDSPVSAIPVVAVLDPVVPDVLAPDVLDPESPPCPGSAIPGPHAARDTPRTTGSTALWRVLGSAAWQKGHTGSGACTWRWQHGQDFTTGPP